MSESPAVSEKYSERNRVRVQVDHDLCVGFGDCAEAAPAVFILNDDQVAVVRDPDSVDLPTLAGAAEACPVSAVLLFGEDGSVLVPFGG
jgi:ferredoxin